MSVKFVVKFITANVGWIAWHLFKKNIIWFDFVNLQSQFYQFLRSWSDKNVHHRYFRLSKVFPSRRTRYVRLLTVVMSHWRSSWWRINRIRQSTMLTLHIFRYEREPYCSLWMSPQTSLNNHHSEIIPK